MSFRLVHKPEVRELTTRKDVEELAKQIDSYGGTESEREEKARREAQIKDKILQGEMKPFDWAVGYVPGGVRHRVNGQHSCKVFLALNDEEWTQVRFPVYAVYQEWECDTEIDLATLFEQFDAHWSVRSREDLIGAHLGVHPEMLDIVSRKSADKAVQGLMWYLQNVEGYKRGSAHEQFQLLHQNSEKDTFFRFCGREGLNLGPKTRDMSHKAVVAAMFHTTRQGTDDDRNFWKIVSGGPQSMNNQESHAYKLAMFLERATTHECSWPAAQSRQFKNRTGPNPLEIFTTCLRVFSAYKKGLPLSEVFAAVRNQDAKDAVMKLYPLTGTEEIAA